jgi:hypothetical protein
MVTYVTQEDEKESRELVDGDKDDASRDNDKEVDKLQEAPDEKEEDNNSKAKAGTL